MMTAAKRKYPIGIQSFEKIRRGGYVYVDKTELIYKLISEGCPYFFSRPRRFGKSLLVSTLQAVFEGKRELFEEMTLKDGTRQPCLFIATTDWDWEPRPVLHFDFSGGDIETIEQLDELIDNMLKGYERLYRISETSGGTNERMKTIIRTSHAQTGQRVVVLVDEYDNFILHHLDNPQQSKIARQRFQNLFGPLKEMDDHLEFVFITGISKFSQMGIFSKLNQLKNISLRPDFEALCGITEEELVSTLRPDIEHLASLNGIDFEQQVDELKNMYDGYHFSHGLTDIYNPFSLMNALDANMLSNYWFASGTSSALIEMLAQMPPIELQDLVGISIESTAFDLPISSFDDPIPLLYQSGYLTINDYRKDRNLYQLGFPNKEVRQGFADCLFQHVTNSKPSSRWRSALLNAYYNFRDSDDLPSFIEALKSFYASVPYQLDNKNEHHYHALLYTLLTAFGADVSAEESTAQGRSDIVLRMPKTIYILEIKYDKSAEIALRQISDKDYAGKYHLDSRPIVKVALTFSGETRNIAEWKIE